MARAVSRRKDATRHRVDAPILVVTGLKREAACVTGDGMTTLCSGADIATLRAALDQTHGADFSCVVSFGLAGGLDYSLRPGDVVVGDTVVDGATRRDAHSRLADVLEEGIATAGVSAVLGAIVGVDRPAMDLAAKAALREASKAIAVDMESHVVAAYAEARKLPFAVVRAISDPAARALPPLAVKAITPEGAVDVIGVMRELIRAPRQMGDLIRAGLDSRAAFASLGRCGPLLGPLLRLVLADL